MMEIGQTPLAITAMQMEEYLVKIMPIRGADHILRMLKPRLR